MAIENLEYNTLRPHLIIPEYGRHLQKMIDYAISIDNQEKRNDLAKAIIGVMGNLSPHLRDVPEFQCKLWDQLFIMSDFNLDVESPFPKISKETLEEHPEKLSYPKSNQKYRFYGNNIKKMIEKACSWKDKSTQNELYTTIATHMKKSYLNWNKDTVEDELIFEHLRELSNGDIDLTKKNISLVGSEKLLNLSAPQNGSNYAPKGRYKNSRNKQKNRNING